MNHEHYGKTCVNILNMAAAARVREITEAMAEETNKTVQAGPFKGMKLPDAVSWGNGDICPKLLGTYEQELHVAIETCIARKPEYVVNVGCAEGYYAVGLALRMPKVSVFSYDSDVNARSVVHDADHINNAGNICVNGKCHPQNLSNPDWDKTQHGLFVIDIEGAELELLSGSRVPESLKRADLIVECHDFVDPMITQSLQDIYQDTHDITIIREGPRDPSGFEVLKNLSSLDRGLAVCEFRPVAMHWLVAMAKQ